MAYETAALVLAEARRVLNDTNPANYRHTDATLLNAVSNGVRELERLRPDVMLDVAVPEAVATNTPLSAIDQRYRHALVDYTCYYAELMDLETADAGRANLHLAKFTRKVGGAG
jgi:hypothetical protein